VAPASLPGAGSSPPASIPPARRRGGRRRRARRARPQRRLGVGVPGTILDVAVAEGDRVTAGQVLVRLDPAAADADVAAAKAAEAVADAA